VFWGGVGVGGFEVGLLTMAEIISVEESFEYSLLNFLKWLEIMTMEPIELCNAWGNYNVAWELVSDLKGDGNVIVTLPCSYLTDYQNQEVSSFLSSLGDIPEPLLVSATTTPANQEAMSHSCWMPYRESALELIETLESAAKRNKEYFASQ
jgi:hypothetical protein